MKSLCGNFDRKQFFVDCYLGCDRFFIERRNSVLQNRPLHARRWSHLLATDWQQIDQIAHAHQNTEAHQIVLVRLSFC